MKKKILYIEKEKFLRQSLELFFKKLGYEIYTLETLDLHEYLLAELSPEVILADLDSISDDQMSLLKELKEVRLLFTAKNTDGHKDVLLKPFNIANLLTQLGIK